VVAIRAIRVLFAPRNGQQRRRTCTSVIHQRRLSE
jgi:hypothetical protein